MFGWSGLSSVKEFTALPLLRERDGSSLKLSRKFWENFPLFWSWYTKSDKRKRKNVELVGVINAEMGLMYPDFRAPERLYDLLVQISGRAGRGNRPGRMVLQSMNPTHYAIRELLSGEYMSFYN